MAKIVLDDVSNTPNMFVGVNNNSNKIEIAFENTLSRDGTGPNHMIADLNMNGYNIINQGNPVVVEGIEWKGDWITSFPYKVGDIVRHTTGTYIAIVAHTSGDFPTDLINNRWQMFVPTPQDQVNADWEATEGVAEILNKPTIIDPVNADWTAGGGLSEILNKPTISPLGTSLIAATTAKDARTIIDALGDGNKNSLEFGDSTVAGSRFIDFHTSGNPTDYDARILATGGNAVTGNGQLEYKANTHTFTGLVVPQSSVGIKGTTTNDNAQAGSVGEYISSIIIQSSAVVLTSDIVSNITSIQLTAGDWDVEAYVRGIALDASQVFHLQGSVSLTSLSLSDYGRVYLSLPTGMNYPTGINIGGYTTSRIRISLNNTTTVYFTASSGFVGGSVGVFGGISARRIR